MQDQHNIIIKGLKKGSEKAYAQLYDIYFEDLVKYCYNLTGDLAMAEDIVQNVFIKIWNSRKKLMITTSLKSYLYRAVYNTFAKEYDKSKRREKVLLQIKREVLDELVEMDNGLLEKKLALLNQAIEKLPQKRRTVFLLSKKQGYKYKEIAEELNISEKTVEKHISRSIQQIKEALYQDLPKIFFLFFRNLLKIS